jgi:pimeloyl-ACP methyl ester carboxylesterase
MPITDHRRAKSFGVNPAVLERTDLKTIDFCIEGSRQREIWGVLTVPDKITGSAIVMAHGLLGFKDWSFFPWLSQFFAEAGFPTIRFNFSGSGMGPQVDGLFENLDAFQNDTISKQVEDLQSVIFAVTRGKLKPDLSVQKKVFLWGHSRGGAVCLLSTANSLQVQAVAAWSTIARVNRYLYETKQAWRKQGFTAIESSRTGQLLKSSVDFLDDVEQWGRQGDVPTFLHHLKIPVYLMHGGEDTSVLPDESESLAAIYPQARLAILAGANHKFNSDHPFTKPSEVLIQAAQKTLDFYRDISQAVEK